VRHAALRTLSSALQMFAGRQKFGETGGLNASKISSIRKHNVHLKGVTDIEVKEKVL